LSASEFIPGQRWISNPEPDLGLGMVVSIDDRRVTLNFPAAEEERTYAIHNAPVSRVQYAVGDVIQTADGQTGEIKDRFDNNGCHIYLCEDESGNELIVPEINLEHSVQFSRPQDRLFAGQVDKLSQFRLRIDTLEHHHTQTSATTFGLAGGRVQLLPHQFYIAHEVAHRFSPRVLLADEVGLGKTIEAGLIVHQQLLTGQAERVLITVPDSLIYQWLIEMLRRFNLKFSIMDELRCTAMELSGTDNPFESAQLVLCTQSMLTSNPERLNQMLNCDWDLMVVDEAHHLVWDEAEPEPLYQAVESLAKAIPGLLLLTATPEQLGIESHFARLRLLDPDRYSSLDEFKEEQGHYDEVNTLVQTLTSEQGLTLLSTDTLLRGQLDQYLGEGTSDTLINSEDSEATLDGLINQLLDRHGTGRVLFRNTRDAVPGFPTRVLIPHPLSAPHEMDYRPTDGPIETHLRPELWLGDNWLEEDPRVEWLDDWLKKHRTEKALLICANADTAQALEEFLRLRKGVRSAVFHEKMTLINRDRAAAYFADEDEYAQVLICSEIGSEGRNFQFAQHLIMFDLPLNPDLLEQRIGRLDRIGQKHDVQIHVPYYENSPQAVLLRWFDEGINAFRHTCPAGQELLNQFEEQLTQLISEGLDEAVFEGLIEASKAATQAIHARLQAGRDRLLEMSSCRHTVAAALLESVEEHEMRTPLRNYMERVFDQFGVDQQSDTTHSVILHPTDQMADHRFPGLPDEGCKATYAREEALSREDMQFMSWEHPMVQGAMEMILGSDFGNACVCTVKLPPLQPGSILVEAVYTLHCAAPKALHLQRYQTQPIVRVVMDNNGNDLSKIITGEHLNKLGERVKRHVAQNLIRHAKEVISNVLDKSDAIARKQEQPLVDAALSNATQELDGEISRLEALMKVNRSIRSEELEHLQEKRETIRRHLGDAQLRLDAIRVAVVNE
jgi:ATP-dependent helicase HepA